MGNTDRSNLLLGRRARAASASVAVAIALALVHPSNCFAQAPTESPSDQVAGPATVAAPPSDPDRRPLGVPKGSAASTGTGLRATPDAVPAQSLGIFRTGLSLAFVVSLIVLGAVIARRVARSKGGLAGAFGAGGPAPAGVLEILGRYPVSRGQSLILLRAHSRVLLLGHTAAGRVGRSGGGGMTALAEFTDHDEIAGILTATRDADGDSIAAKFKSMLTGYDRGHDEPADAEPEIETGRRCAGVSPHGDHAELWDDHARGLHLVGEPPPTSPKPHPPIADRQPTLPPQPRDAVSTLQQRLDAMRGPTGAGGESMIARWLPILLAVVCMAAPATAQEVFGPPSTRLTIRHTAPGAPSDADFAALRSSFAQPDESATDPMNPAAILAGAARAFPSAGGSTGGDREGDNRGGLSTSLNIVILLTVITLVPSIMLMTTCFVRIVVVLGLLKQALGTQSLPPPQVIVGLALFMTLLVMAPTIDRINNEAIAPYRAGVIRDYDTLWDRTRAPVRDFMFDQIEATGNWSGVYMVLNYRGIDTSHPEKLTRAHVDMVSLVPAYMLSELKIAFLMGFRVYLPFLVIDMVIASLLISMSMMMLPPVLISLPFKLLLFVLVDGWQLVVGSLMRSFVTHPAGHAVANTTTAALSAVTGIPTG